MRTSQNKLGSPEDRARRSAAIRAAWQRGAFTQRRWEQTPAQMAGLRKAKLASQMPEAIIKLRQSLTGKPKSKIARAAMSIAARRRVATPEGRKALLARGRIAADRARGKPHTEERRAKERASQRARFARPEERLRLVEHCLKIAFRTPGRRHELLDRRGRLHVMRSRQEVRFAEALDRAVLDWHYESARLLLSTGEVYVPDFYVEQWTSYLELKGNESRFPLTKVRQAISDGHPVMFLQITSKSMMNDALRFLAPEVAGVAVCQGPP